MRPLASITDRLASHGLGGGAFDVGRSTETSPLALRALVDVGRIERVESAGQVTYRSHELVLGFDNEAGWEASVEDHFATMARTITRKLRHDPRASRSDEVGGSTYHFVLWRGHPLEGEVLGELARFRQRMSALREHIDTFNAHAERPPARLRVDVYYGQSTWQEEDHVSLANDRAGVLTTEDSSDEDGNES